MSNMNIPRIQYNYNYDKLIKWLGKGNFVIEPSILNCEFAYRGFNQDNIILHGLVYKNTYFFNLYCIRYNDKETDGSTESICHKLGDNFILSLKNPYYKIIPRLDLTEDNLNKYLKRYQNVIIKCPNEKYFSTNINWSWVELSTEIDPLRFPTTDDI